MKNLFNRQFSMLVRVFRFGEKYADLFAPDSLAKRLLAVIGTALPELRKSAGAQEAGFALNREGSLSRALARADLLDCLLPINIAARSMALEDPHLKGKFKMPHSLGDEDVINKANGFLTNAAAMKDAFLAHELDPDFLEELQSAISRFEETIEQAMTAAYRLDGIVQIKLRKNYPVLQEWESARRVPRPRVTKTVSDNQPEPEPQPEAKSESTAVAPT